MKSISDYLDRLSIADYITIYQNELVPFWDTGILSEGHIRNIASLFKDISGTYSIEYGVKQVLERMSEMFYYQNKK